VELRIVLRLKVVTMLKEKRKKGVVGLVTADMALTTTLVLECMI
jgi:hypothetical protein